MKRGYWVAAAIVVVMFTFSASRKAANDSGRHVSVEPNYQDAPFSAENLSAKPAPEIARVARVIDGDTVELDTGEKVRYIGMDTPETVDPRKPVQCFGAEAARRNGELVEGKLVVLRKDISERDKYGRLLRYVWAGNTFVNLELVKEGYATAFTFTPDVKYASDFVAAEKEAREAKRGLWGACYN